MTDTRLAIIVTATHCNLSKHQFPSFRSRKVYPKSLSENMAKAIPWRRNCAERVYYWILAEGADYGCCEKRSFFRFGGKMDKVFNWIAVIVAVLILLLRLPIALQNPHYLPEIIGAAIGQFIVFFVLMFVIFKLISLARR